MIAFVSSTLKVSRASLSACPMTPDSSIRLRRSAASPAISAMGNRISVRSGSSASSWVFLAYSSLYLESRPCLMGVAPPWW